jgi:hypothetical protein
MAFAGATDGGRARTLPVTPGIQHLRRGRNGGWLELAEDPLDDCYLGDPPHEELVTPAKRRQWQGEATLRRLRAREHPVATPPVDPDGLHRDAATASDDQIPETTAPLALTGGDQCTAGAPRSPSPPEHADAAAPTPPHLPAVTNPEPSPTGLQDVPQPLPSGARPTQDHWWTRIRRTLGRGRR